MIIENPEALKSWLTAVLAPLCDADPAALSKYVLALAKKEKPESELRGAMCDQLDVFLQGETKGFVDKLFQTLESKSYLQSNPEPPEDAGQPTISSSGSNNTQTASEEPASKMPTDVVVKSEGVSGSSSRTGGSSGSSKKPSERTKRRSWSPRSRSRSRSRERRRSRSRDRSTRDRGGRGGGGWDDRRRRSPVSSSSHRRTSDRRMRSRSPPPSSGSRRSRSPRSSRRQRSPIQPKIPTAEANGGIPNDPIAAAAVPGTLQSVVVAPTVVGAAAGVAVHQSSSNKFRCRDFDEKGYCMRGDLCPYDHGTDPVVLEDVELSSMLNYNRTAGAVAATAASATVLGVAVVPGDGVAAGAAAGVPPVGPPHLRGPPPSLPSGEPYNPDAPGISWPPPGPPPHMVGPPGIVSMRPPFHHGPPPPPFGFGHHHPGQHQPHHHPHHPNRLPPPPHMRGMRPRGPPPMGLLGTAPPPLGLGGQRELVSVPTAGLGGLDDGSGVEGGDLGGHKRKVVEAGLQSEGNQGSHGLKKGHFDYNRLGNQHQQAASVHRTFDPNNCCLEVKKIPRGLNNISVLNNHFSKFGKIVNLQVSFNGDPEGAMVTFSSHAEAQAAYRSTEAVLNNRFIKVFWHNKEDQHQGGKQAENVPPTPKMPVKERLGGIVTGSGKVLTQAQVPDEAAIKEAAEAKEKEREKAVAAIKRSQEILAATEALKKKQEEQKREATKLQVDLQRRKQELLDKQLQQQRVLIERLEKIKAGEERSQIMATVRNLQESIEKLKRDLQLHSAPSKVVQHVHHHPAAAPPLPPLVDPSKSVQDAKKEVLDTEIELYQKQMEGSDTSELQRRLQELNTIIHHSVRGHPSTVIARRGIRGGRVVRGAVRGTRAASIAASRGSTRGRGRSGYFVGPHVSVDRRPTQLKVTGFEASQQGEILAHFADFGEVVDYQADELVPSLTIRYKARMDAEVALSQGKVSAASISPAIQVAWLHASGSASTVKVKKEEGTTDDGDEGLADQDAVGGGAEADDAMASADEDEEEENQGLMDDLLNYEEEDEDEERSWRR